MVGNQREWPTDGHKGIGMNNRDNPDPLDEANVYLAYGRTEQAAKILEQAIREEPTRRDCQRLLDQMQTAKEVLNK
jgi:Tfp pilus assembly protein FimV